MSDTYKLISDQVTQAEIKLVLASLTQVLAKNVPGDVVELGCYVGTTSLHLQKHLLQSASTNRLHVYDSFAGLPPKSSHDASPAGEQFVTGALSASKTVFINNFKKVGLQLPIIHKGWFNQLTSADMPKSICLAFLDGDYYDSIKDSLTVITPHLSSGAIILIDDYLSEQLPGAKKAADAWATAHGQQIRVEAGMAVIVYHS